MAEQRSGQLRRDARRRGAGGRRLGLALPLLLSLAACSESSGPSRIEGNIGLSGGLSPAESVAGTWRAQTLVDVPGDAQLWIITWTFDPAGPCHQTLEIRSVSGGEPRTTDRDCTFTADGSVIAVTYDDGGRTSFNYGFAGPPGKGLVLDGIEYARVP